MESDCKSESSQDIDTIDISDYTDDRIEQAIRSVVRKAFRTDEADLLTYRRIRTATEKKLRLANGSFKNDLRWAKKSKQVVDDAMTREERISSKNSNKELSPADEGNAAISRNAAKRKHGYSSSNDQDEPLSNSRLKASKETKRRTTSSTSSSQASNDNELKTSTHTDRRRNKRAVPHVEREQSETMISDSTATVTKLAKDASDVTSHSEMSIPNILSQQEEKNIVIEKGQTVKDSAENSESELSEVIDEAPPPSKRKKVKNQNTDKVSGKNTMNSKVKQNLLGGKLKVDDKLSPQEAEIKRLQSWLMKCGIRKVWSKELASHVTARAKIQHLRDMLKNAGMEGRFSVEKANRIKEQRELKADLEAVQEGAKMWGQTESGDSAKASKPERGKRLARGLRNLDFLGSDDGEETD